MPYEVSFSKAIKVSDPGIYINKCCWGGDVVRDQLLPTVSAKFEDIQTNQEDWGWFIWFKRGSVHLAVDIFCDDPKTGKFRIRLTSRRKKLLLLHYVVDTPELDDIRQLVCTKIEAWGGNPRVQSVPNY